MSNRSINKHISLYKYLIILLIIVVINIILDRFGLIVLPIGPGSSALFFPVAFMIAFSLWFGAWGVIATYLGCLIGSSLVGNIPLDVNLYWSLANIWQVLIPLIAFRKFDADVRLVTRKDFLIFLNFGWILNNLVGAFWGSSTLALGGVVLWNDVPSIFTGWLIGNLIVTIMITPLLLRYITPYILRGGLYVGKYWV